MNEHAEDHDRLIDEAIRTAPAEPLPADFASSVAARVADAPAMREGVIEWALVALMIGVGAVYLSGRLLQWIDAAPEAAGWLATLGACAAFSAVLHRYTPGQRAR